MFRSFLFLIILTWFPGLAAGADSIRITIENRSPFSVLLQVRDDVCKTTFSDACIQADFIDKSAECRETPTLNACVGARQKLEGGSCVEGLVYEGNLGAGGKISLSVCANPSEYGRVSMRDLNRNPSWKTNTLVSNGDVLSYP